MICFFEPFTSLKTQKPINIKTTDTKKIERYLNIWFFLEVCRKLLWNIFSTVAILLPIKFSGKDNCMPKY
jgi:hypothetical protein